MLQKVENALMKHQEVVHSSIDTLQNYIYMASLLSYEAALRGNRLFVYGDGQSHYIAAYMVTRLKGEYPDLSIFLLNGSENNITYFEESVQSLDLFLTISSKGKSDVSANLLEIARDNGCKTVGLCSSQNAVLYNRSDVSIVVSSAECQRVDEVHLLICNIIAESIETILKVAR